MHRVGFGEFYFPFMDLLVNGIGGMEAHSFFNRYAFLLGIGFHGIQPFFVIPDTLFRLPDDTEVYPGHDQSTTIFDERRYNMFL